VSPIALALYHHLRRQPEDVDVLMEELTIQLHASKTKIRAAFDELEHEGLVTYTQES